MRKIQFVVIASLSAVLLVLAGPAAAQKKEKVSKQEAWSRCAADVSVIPADQVGQRYARGAACMKKYGYKI